MTIELTSENLGNSSSTTHTHTHAHTHTRTHAHTCAHTRSHTNTRTHTHTQTHTHIRTHIPGLRHLRKGVCRYFIFFKVISPPNCPCSNMTVHLKFENCMYLYIYMFAYICRYQSTCINIYVRIYTSM